MNLLHHHFLQILSGVLHDRPELIPEPAGPEEWHDLFSMGCTHKILPMIYEAAHLKGALMKYPELLSIRSLVLQQVMEQTRKTSEFLAIYDTLSQAGIPPLVVKGIVCRGLYSRMDMRPSSDEDLLVSPEMLPKCRSVLQKVGFVCDETAGEEISCRKTGSPLHIELHGTLFPREQSYGTMNNLFEGIFDRSQTIRIEGTALSVPDHTDHLLYLICHSFKHFIHSGFGIRQVCDVMMYTSTWGHFIDWSRVIDGCQAVRAEVFAAALFRIGVNHLGFSADGLHLPDCWRNIELCEIPLLEDILLAGIYGTSTAARQHSSNITLKAAGAAIKGETSRRRLSAALFPSAIQIRSRYPYLRKHPWLLPIAWFSRIVSYKKWGSESMEALQTGHSRLILLAQYDIIEKS